MNKKEIIEALMKDIDEIVPYFTERDILLIPPTNRFLAKENNNKLEYLKKVILNAINKAVEDEREKFIRQLKERKYLISKDGMAEEYIQELINDYESLETV